MRPRYLAEDEYSASREPEFLRSVTLGLAAQMTFGRVYSCSLGQDCTGAEPSRIAVAGTPTIDLLAEFGGRRLRLALGVYSSPAPLSFGDHVTGVFLGARFGLLVGNEKVRAGVTAGGGYFAWWEVNGHLFVTPWRDRRGGRHGVALAVGSWVGWPSVTLGYRFAPAAWNHVGGRQAAMRRARGE